MPDPIPLPVQSKPVLTIDRARAYFVVPISHPGGGLKCWSWGCQDCDASGEAHQPDELGRQLTEHHAKCTK